MLPIFIVVGALIFLLYVISGSRTVKLPAMTPGRRREILDGRYEEAARSSRIQAVASSKASYGPLSEEERETFCATRERMEHLSESGMKERPMLTTIPFTNRIGRDHDDRVRGYVEEMNEIVRRCHDRGEETLGGVIDYGPERDAAPPAEGLEYPPFVLLDEQPLAVLEYPAIDREAPSTPDVATFEEQLALLSTRRRLADAA